MEIIISLYLLCSLCCLLYLVRHQAEPAAG